MRMLGRSRATHAHAHACHTEQSPSDAEPGGPSEDEDQGMLDTMAEQRRQPGAAASRAQRAREGGCTPGVGGCGSVGSTWRCPCLRGEVKDRLSRAGRRWYLEVPAAEGRGFKPL